LGIGLKNRYLFIVIACYALAHIVVFAAGFGDASRFVEPDSRDYLVLADSLVVGKGYVHAGEPEIFRAPGYPFFIAPLRWLFPDSVVPIIVVQIVISCGSLILLWRLASLSFGEAVAKWAVAIQACSVVSIVFANKVLSETLFTFVLLSFFLLLEMALKAFADGGRVFSKRVLSLFLAAGAAGGALVFIRAIFLPFFPLALFYVWWRSGSVVAKKPAESADTGSRNPRRFGVRAALLGGMVAPFCLIVGGWTVRNVVTADYAGFSSVGSINIYRYYACVLMAENEGVSFAERQARCDKELSALGSQAERARYSVEKGAPVLLKSPVRAVVSHLKADISSLLPDVGDLYRMFGVEIGGGGTLSVIRGQGVFAGVKHYFDGKWLLFFLSLPFVGILFAKYALSAIGSVNIFRPRFNLALLFYAVFAAYMLAVPGAVSHPRFRVPVEPLLSIFAALGIVSVFLLAKRRSGAF
jgi:hypothetical protein